MAHRVSYHLVGAGVALQAGATCPCGWSKLGRPNVVSAAGPKHVLDAWDREHAA